MKAASLIQPWASLWAHGVKIHETRSRPMSYRGLLLIHASRTRADAIAPALAALCAELFGRSWALTLPRGAFIGYGQVTGCLRTRDVTRGADRRDLLSGNFGPGRWAIRLAGAAVLAKPIDWRGQQMMPFDVPDAEILDRLPAALAQLVNRSTGAPPPARAVPQGSLL